MNSDLNEKADFGMDSPGDRLNYLLDQIGFISGRGRVVAFQNYLIENAADMFEDLKYTTVRSWFQEHAPPMRKIDSIIEALQLNYPFDVDKTSLKTWWKLGGEPPFATNNPKDGLDKEFVEKLEFVVMSFIIEEAGESFSRLDTSELIHIKNSMVSFAKDYANPSKTKCPDDVMRCLIKSELSKIKNIE